jgi:hypothetical protein
MLGHVSGSYSPRWNGPFLWAFGKGDTMAGVWIVLCQEAETGRGRDWDPSIPSKDTPPMTYGPPTRPHLLKSHSTY